MRRTFDRIDVVEILQQLVRGWFPGLVDANARSLTDAETDAHRGDLVVAIDGCFSRHCQQISALGDEHVPQ
jgi:hypothetical protein